MRIRGAALAVALLATVALAGPLPAQAADPELPALVPDKLKASIACVPSPVARCLPGGEATGALVRIRGSAGSWQGTSGVADIATRERVSPDSRFRIGSMTKSFTATVALQLVAEGKLDLGQTVQRYLPDLLPEEPPVTVLQVLQYSSGINGVGVPHKTPAWFFAHRYDTWTPGSQLDVVRPLAFPPGTKQSYGNADYIVAGLLIEKVTGHAWEDEITTRIITPLGLTGTSAPKSAAGLPEPHVTGYEAVTENGETSWVNVTAANPSLQWSAAAMISTAADLDKFLVALFRGKLVRQDLFPLMLNPPKVFEYNPLCPADKPDPRPICTKPATHTAGLTKIQFGSAVLYGKTGDRPGYVSGMGTTPDLSRRLVYSVNPLHMGGEQSALTQAIVAAAYLP